MVALSDNTLAAVILILRLSYAQADDDDDPCKTTKVIDNYKRSVAYETLGEGICDNFINEGWYRVTSGAGELMPTQCPAGGFRCGTNRPIYISNESIPAGEDVYPGEGVTVTRNAYEANYDGNCKHANHTVQIKGCHGYYVYYLKPVVGCYAAYCFGNQLQCPEGLYSETGFTPNCKTYPEVTVTPKVTTNSLVTEKVNDFGVDMVYSTAIFECHANDLTDDHKYKVRWYVNDREMVDASQTDLTKDDIVNGKARMLEEHWTPFFKPNMLVKCGLQITGDGFTGYGPPHMSELFFAGLQVEQSYYIVLEGEDIEIPAKITMPISCSWRKNMTPAQIESIQANDCILVLLNGIPGYQTDGQHCSNGISADGIAFEPEWCGIKFSYKTWNETQMIKITGQTDQIVNTKDRLVFIRLYNADKVTPNNELIYWKNIHLPDLKVYIKDTDVTTLGQSCYSNNDPHMRTFDGKTWELQISNGLTTGEYIMYKHTRLPLQVTAYFKSCHNSVLCNCGVAVRSGDSLFVANYCQTVYKGVQRVNRYMIQRLCDDQSLVVEKTSTSYTITLPTGTKVTFSYGSNWIDRINITPSILDRDLTSGLCGSYNGNSDDDFIPREQFEPVTSPKEFASSWRVSGSYKDETLFDPEGQLKRTEYNGRKYCTCVSPVVDFPHGSPDINCQLTAAMEQCRKTKSVHGVYTASCVTEPARRKRAALIQKREVVNQKEDDEPMAFPMDNEETVTTNEQVVEWRNGWTEDTARLFCENKFKSAPAYDICSEYVPSVETEPYIEGCILDIKHTGGDSWLKVTLKNYAGSCLQESKKLENLTSTNSTNSTGVDKPIAEIIEEVSCPDNCSNHGICVAGECQCYAGFFGELCDGTRSRPPRVIKEAFEDLCDTNVRPCQTFLLYGENFIEGADFKCKFTVVQLKEFGSTTILEEGETFIHSGTYATPLYMKCKLPESRKKRSADFVVVATGYHISVSNDGISYTDPVTTIVYDSNCYLCNSTSMICEKQKTCPVEEKAESDDDKVSNIRIAVGVAIAVIVLLVITFIVIKTYTSKEKYIRDSTFSLPNTTRQIAPRAHMLTDRDIFLCEKS